VTPRPARPLALALVRRLWRGMSHVYGHRWTAQYGPLPPPGVPRTPAQAAWARGLAGLAAPDLDRGLARVERGDAPWPPTLPEFRALCRPRPEDFGLPAPDAALAEAVRARRAPGAPWSHPAVRLAAEAADARPGATLAERDALFRRAYRHLVRRVMAGRPLAPPPPEALGPPPEPPASPAEARRHLAALQDLVGAGPWS